MANAVSSVIVVFDGRLENHCLMVPDFELTLQTKRIFHTIWHPGQQIKNLGKEEGMGGKFPSYI